MKQILNHSILYISAILLFGCSNNSLNSYATFTSMQTMPPGNTFASEFQTVAMESMVIQVPIQKGVSIDSSDKWMILKIPKNTILGASLTRYQNECIVTFNNLHILEKGYYSVDKQINCNNITINAKSTEFKIQPFEFVVTPNR